MELNDIQLKEMIRNNAFDTISANFTSQLMQKLEVMQVHHIQYEPIISKRAWFIIASITTFIVGGLIVFVLSFPAQQSSPTLYIDFQFISTFFSQLLSVSYSSTTTAVVVVSAVFFWLTFYFEIKEKKFSL